MGQVIGIDLGTTYSRVAVMEGDRPVIVPNEDGARETPSAVGFTDDHRAFVGLRARRRTVVAPDRSIVDLKRLLGRRIDEALADAPPALYPYLAADDDGAHIEVDGRRYAPHEFSAVLLAELRGIAEAHLDESVEEAVITVPAFFTDAQRHATKEAAEIAGLEVRRFIHEPTAAALTYGYLGGGDATIAVFDLGGGTFDISILDLHDGVFEVRSTAGHKDLGGRDFDLAVAAHLAEKFQSQTGRRVSDDPVALQRLMAAAERARCELSTLTRTYLEVPRLADGPDGPADLSTALSRTTLESLVDDLVDKLNGPCRHVLGEADLAPSEIDEVFLVGGLTRMPAVRRRVEQLFAQAPNTDFEPTDMVARGAAIQAGILSGRLDEFILLDVTPMNLGIRIDEDDFSTIIPRNTALPTRETKVFTTTDDDQSVVTIEVLQGNSDRASDNTLLGMFSLTGIPEAEAGSPRIEVTFELDADGLVDISARDLETDAEQSMTVESHRGRSGEAFRPSENPGAERTGDPNSAVETEKIDLDVDEFGEVGDEWLSDRSTSVTTVVDEESDAAEATDSPPEPGAEPSASSDDESNERRRKIESLRESAASRINRKIENLEDADDPDVAQGYFNHGYEEFKDHNHPNAMRYFEKAYEFDPDNALYKTFYGYVRFLLNPETADDSKQLLREALWADDPQPDPDAHFFLGRILKADDHYRLARRHFQKALDLDPKRKEAEREIHLCKQREDPEEEQDAESAIDTGQLLSDFFDF